MSMIAIIDGHQMAFRSFFSVPLLATSTGIHTNAVVGSLKSFRSIISTLKPDFCLLCWDSGKKSFRNELDINYKSTRQPVANELKTQFALLQMAFSILGVPQMIASDGIEGDDLVATIATKAANGGINAIIVSSDKDFYQLCNKYIKCWSFSKAKKMGNGMVDIKYIQQEFGVNPDQLIHIKSMTGETVDNIKGVKGIGPKTATKLIQEHGTVHNLLKHLENNLTHKNYIIYEHRNIVNLAYSLAKIKTDVEIDEIPVLPVDRIICDEDKLRAFFRRLEMNSFLEEFNRWSNLFSYKTCV